MKVESERLILYPSNNEEMKAMIEKENAPEMKQAYTDRLEGCLSNPRERMWHTAWNMGLKNGTGKYDAYSYMSEGVTVQEDETPKSQLCVRSKKKGLEFIINSWSFFFRDYSFFTASSFLHCDGDTL